jgi:hypothetical protein
MQCSMHNQCSGLFTCIMDYVHDFHDVYLYTMCDSHVVYLYVLCTI